MILIVEASMITPSIFYSMIKKETCGSVLLMTESTSLKPITSLHIIDITPPPNSLSNNLVLAIYEDVNENLWIGTDGGGLNKLERKEGKFTHYRHDANQANSIGGDYVLTVTEDQAW